MGKFQTGTNTSITIRDITSTLMACGNLPATGIIPDDIQLKNKETSLLLTGLQAAKSYTLTGGKLALMGSNGTILLEFSGS
jgi:heat shock protein HslJ